MSTLPKRISQLETRQQTNGILPARTIVLLYNEETQVYRDASDNTRYTREELERLKEKFDLTLVCIPDNGRDSKP